MNQLPPGSPPQGGGGQGPPRGGYPQGPGQPGQGGWGSPGPAQGGPRVDWYAPPQGSMGAPSPGPLMTTAIQERNSGMVILFSILTCGIYKWYWLYTTTEELRTATSDTSLNPGLDLVLLFVTCGLWGIFAEYRNAQKIHAALVRYEPNRKDQSTAVLLFAIFVPFIAPYLVQEE